MNSSYGSLCFSYIQLMFGKDLQSENKLPVMVFIHGGGHSSGSGSLYGPAYLLDKQNVILVTFNYRLGILGKHINMIVLHVIAAHV